MDKSLCLMFVHRDGHTADADNQRQRRRHIYVAYGPPHGQYALIAMPAMPAIFGALAAEVQALLISSDNVGVLGSVTFASQALPYLLIPRFLQFT